MAARRRERLDTLGNELSAHVEPADATVSKAVEKAFATAYEKFGRLDGVVNCFNSLLLTGQVIGVDGGLASAQANGKFTVTPSWTHKSLGYMSTPVIIDGVAYEHLKSQRVMAIEVETGRELWTSDKSFGKYWSLVAQGDRILALDHRGQSFLFRANKEKFDLLDQRKLTNGETWAHLAAAGDELFVRELNALVVYRWTSRDKTLTEGETRTP